MTHEVSLMCSCPDVALCRTERYIADIRTLLALYGDPLAMKPKRKFDRRDNVITIRPEDAADTLSDSKTHMVPEMNAQTA